MDAWLVGCMVGCMVGWFTPHHCGGLLRCCPYLRLSPSPARFKLAGIVVNRAEEGDVLAAGGGGGAGGVADSARGRRRQEEEGQGGGALGQHCLV